MGQEVSPWAVKSHLDVFRKHFGGKLPQGVFDGLPWTEEQLKSASGRIDWDPYAELLDRLGAKCGGDDEIVRVGRAMDHVDQNGLIQSMVQGVVSPGMLLQFWKMSIPRLWRAMEASVRRMGDRHAEMHVWVKDGYRGCRTMFVGSIGSIATSTARIGLPEIVVSPNPEIDDRHGRYEIEIPKSETIPAKLSRRWQALRM